MAAQSLHRFDLKKFYGEVQRVLKDGGIIAAWTYNLLRINPELDDVIRRFYADILGPYWPVERKHVEAGYGGIAFPFSELPPPTFDMEAQWSVDQVLGYLNTWSAVQRYTKVIGKDPMQIVENDIRRLWGEPFLTRAVRWPLAMRVGINTPTGD